METKIDYSKFDFIFESFKFCQAPTWAKHAAIEIVRHFTIGGICDAAYIAHCISATGNFPPMTYAEIADRLIFAYSSHIDDRKWLLDTISIHNVLNALD